LLSLKTCVKKSWSFLLTGMPIEHVRERVCVFGSAPFHTTTYRYSSVITWLLKHNPDERPTALELSQSSLLPPRLEDEYFRGALKMMSKSSNIGPGRNQRIPQPKAILLTGRRFSRHSSIRLPEACAGFSMIMMLNIRNIRH
jgi:hypothetical protein